MEYGRAIFSLKNMGERLRQERLARNDTQKVFAARLAVSTPTYKKMEDGDPRVQIGLWAAALDILGRLQNLENILAPPEDLFAKHQLLTTTSQRKRAAKRNKP